MKTPRRCFLKTLSGILAGTVGGSATVNEYAPSPTTNADEASKPNQRDYAQIGAHLKAVFNDTPVSLDGHGGAPGDWGMRLMLRSPASAAHSAWLSVEARGQVELICGDSNARQFEQFAAAMAGDELFLVTRHRKHLLKLVERETVFDPSDFDSDGFSLSKPQPAVATGLLLAVVAAGCGCLTTRPIEESDAVGPQTHPEQPTGASTPQLGGPSPEGPRGSPMFAVGVLGLKYYSLSNSGPKFDIVKEVVDDLRERLRADVSCVAWLQAGSNGGYAFPSLLARLADMTQVAGRIEAEGQNAPAIAATANDLPGVAIIINGQGAFFYGGVDRVETLLHELAHLTGAPGFIQNDGSETKRSTAQARNRTLLTEKCGNTLTVRRSTIRRNVHMPLYGTDAAGRKRW